MRQISNSFYIMRIYDNAVRFVTLIGPVFSASLYEKQFETDIPPPPKKNWHLHPIPRLYKFRRMSPAGVHIGHSTYIARSCSTEIRPTARSL